MELQRNRNYNEIWNNKVFKWKCFEFELRTTECIRNSTDSSDLKVANKFRISKIRYCSLMIKFKEETNIFVRYNEEFVKTGVR